jgi:hypothetical protein
MAVTRLKGGERRFEIAVARGTDPKIAAGAIARFHRAQVQKARQENKNLLHVDEDDIEELTTVDGRRGAPLESVKIDGGVIVTTFPFAIGPVLEYLDYLLVTRSPVLSGKYQRSHRLFADGSETDPLNPRLDAKNYIFTSNLPYARKIEGSTLRPPQGSAPQEGVYRGAVKLATQRYGSFVQIRFTFQSILEGGAPPSKKTERQLRYPAIRVSLR